MNNSAVLLLVDDDPIVLTLHQMLLKKAGLTNNIFCAANGEQALNFMDSCGPQTEFLILLDINMPIMNGWEFLDALQDHPYLFNTRVFMVTSADSAEMQRAANFRQVINSLSKPLSLSDCKLIQSWLKPQVGQDYRLLPETNLPAS
ncbi:response regulator [Dyadobacter alkalitolerans]|uniref:response regulator n=1 Tax=Dyadobacter alkalitolerans TaxID=492736 RepID=UPI00146FB0BC|nr:response regulator [Dyadobacter alkalitolerans]